MINKLRILTLLLAISIAGYAVHSFLSKLEATSENIDFRISKEDLNIEIKKFKVIHENSGRTEWELKADIAEINKKNKTTKMSNVEYLYINQNNKKFKVSADYGTLKNKTNDLNLEGHVKMIIEPTILSNILERKPVLKSQPES